MLTTVLSLFLSFGCTSVEPGAASLDDLDNKVIFVYPAYKKDGRDLITCEKNFACNVIYKRYWLSSIVESLCRCPYDNYDDCSWTYTDVSNNYTMSVDNRSQMKFCSNVRELPTCEKEKPALELVIKTPKRDGSNTLTARTKHLLKPKRKTERRNLTALCNCPEPHQWKLQSKLTKYNKKADEVTQIYYCSEERTKVSLAGHSAAATRISKRNRKTLCNTSGEWPRNFWLNKCKSFELCGFMRVDTRSIFYKCSCPEGHMCLTKDKVVFKVEELLFNGNSYKAYCLPSKPGSKN